MCLYIWAKWHLEIKLTSHWANSGKKNTLTTRNFRQLHVTIYISLIQYHKGSETMNLGSPFTSTFTQNAAKETICQ